MGEEGGAPPDRLVGLSSVGTGAFAVSSAAGAAAPELLGVAAAAVSVLLFVVGCGAFLWAYAVAIGRSRAEQVDLAGLFFLTGSAPRPVRVRLRAALAVQVVVAVGAASIRPFTVAAFGVLAPMFGLGMMGAWGARHGSFAPKDPDGT